MNIIEDIRKDVVDGLFNTNTVRYNWPQWSRRIKEIMGNNPTPQSVLSIGDNLANIFKLTGTEGREQSDLSAGGTGWEALVSWYFNLCTAGTRVVAVKKKSMIPSPIKDSFTVNYSSFACSSESDITVIVFPDNPVFTDDNPSLYGRTGKINKKALDELVDAKFTEFSVGIIQCKTNWNDNAQIPMLWDMIYDARKFRSRQITVGANNFNTQALKGFSYSFVTVPTNKLSGFKTTSTCVGRVKNLSGGNYWGYPTANGIARNVKEIFQNFEDGFVYGNIRQTLQSALSQLNGDLSYFRI